MKRRKPYNAVVAIIDIDGSYCTGTIVKGKDGKPYLYTAKHCTDRNRDNIPDDFLWIQLQNGRIFLVDRNNFGSYLIRDDLNFGGDWAIYEFQSKDLEYVSSLMVEISRYKLMASAQFSYDARLVGYGGLRIMSDKEIFDFKRLYMKYLKDNKNIESDGTETIYGFDHGGVDTLNNYVINFITSGMIDWNSLIGDGRNLKVSFCSYASSDGAEIFCQSWGGNSGGPIFDDKDAIMGIHTRVNFMIGGKKHASREKGDYFNYPMSVPLLKKFGKGAKNGK